MTPRRMLLTGSHRCSSLSPILTRHGSSFHLKTAITLALGLFLDPISYIHFLIAMKTSPLIVTFPCDNLDQMIFHMLLQTMKFSSKFLQAMTFSFNFLQTMVLSSTVFLNRLGVAVKTWLFLMVARRHHSVMIISRKCHRLKKYSTVE